MVILHALLPYLQAHLTYVCLVSLPGVLFLATDASRLLDSSDKLPSTKMADKALVTGASGLLGRQVLVAFKEAGWDVIGTGFSRAKPPTIVKLDLADADAVSGLLDSEK